MIFRLMSVSLIVFTMLTMANELDKNLVPANQRTGVRGVGGHGVNLQLSTGKMYLIMCQAKLRESSVSPDPKVRLVVRFPLKNGKFDHQWGDFQGLRKDSEVSLNMLYKAKEGQEQVMVIISPRNLLQEDKMIFCNFTILEVEEDLE